MAPDLNSVPPSPRPLASSPRMTSIPTSRSRRASQQMAPPPLPLSSPALNVLPSNQVAVNSMTSQSTVSPGVGGVMATTGHAGDNTGVGTGPGPLRHPRPLTAADLHMQLEKEQEAVVNRLTRELSMLRAAQNASVVSNSSSTSAGLPDTSDHNTNHMLSGPGHPIPSQRRHHRSSSSTSTRSNTGFPGGIISSAAPAITTDRSRVNTTRPDAIPQELSRQNSLTSSRRSGASSPAPASASSYQHPDYFPPGSAPQRPSISGTRTISGSGNENERQIPTASSASMTSITSMTSVQTTGRYEEAAYHRHELEAVKRENETLKRKIRELERTLRERRRSDASVRSGVSVGIGGGNRDSFGMSMGMMTGIGRGTEHYRDGEREGDMQEEVVRVGESASNAGLS